jgi:uncharacterized protein YndB with AHSA1/START domain
VGNETGERSRTVAAPPDRVWAVLGDVTRMPEWSEDLESVELIDGDGRSVGARFRGNNRSGSRTWSMTCVVDEYDDGRSIVFHTENDRGEARTRWWYRIEPAADGTVVTEGFLRLVKLGRVRAMAERKLIGDRSEYNARNIDESLRRLAEVVEAPA